MGIKGTVRTKAHGISDDLGFSDVTADDLRGFGMSDEEVALAESGAWVKHYRQSTGRLEGTWAACSLD